MRRRRKGPDALLTAKLDKAWSDLIRSRGSCERCGRSDGKLDAAHIVGRQNRRLRWEPRNGWCACFRCHRWNHDHPLEFAEWIRDYRPDDVHWLYGHKNEVTHYSLSDKRIMLESLLMAFSLPAESDAMADEAA